MNSQALITAIRDADRQLSMADDATFAMFAEQGLGNLLDMLVARIFHLWDMQEIAKRGSVPHDVETELDRELAALIVVAKEFKLGSF